MVAQVDGIVSKGHLRRVWKEEIRPRLRSARLRDLYLPQDPLQFAAYEWGLSALLDRLSTEVESGTYTPDAAHIVRGAKAQGLSRPLAFLSPRDSLLYKSIIVAAQPDLDARLSDRVGATLADKERLKLAPDKSALEYGDWFRIWLAKQGIIKQLLEDFPFIVESDIANYFPSVDLRIVAEHLHSRTGLERDVVRLCGFLLDQVMRHPTYASAPSLGLPQEPFDASRAIGHSLLAELDTALESRGYDYARFMDDIVIGAESREQAEAQISTIQRALEPLGLYPNTAKTRIVRSAVYLDEIMAEENGRLDEIEAELDAAEKGELRVIDDPDGILAKKISDAALAHRNLDRKPPGWSRVLLRYYTAMRRAGDPTLLEFALDDMRTEPSMVRNVLEYVRSFPLTADKVESLFEFAGEASRTYGDLPLLALETLANAPNHDDADLVDAIAKHGLNFAVGVGALDTDPESKDRILAAALPIVAKFGDLETRLRALDTIWPHLPEKSLSRLQALAVAVAEGKRSAAATNQAIPGLAWSDVINLEFLRALEEGQRDATGVLLGVLTPQRRLQPTRWHTHVRPLILVGILKRSAPERLASAVPEFVAKLRENPDRLRDHRAETLLLQAVS